MKKEIVKIKLIIITFLLTKASSAWAVTCGTDYQEENGVCFPANTGLSDLPIYDLLSNFLQWILGIFGFLGVIAFVISGIQYVTSTGDEKQIETAKRNMKWSIIGIIVGLSGLIVLVAIDSALGGSTNF